MRESAAVNVDTLEVRLQNGCLESLLRLTAWEQQFAKRVETDVAFSGDAVEGQSSMNGSSSSISKHAAD